MVWPIVMFHGEVVYFEWKCIDDETGETVAKGNVTWLRRGHRGACYIKCEQLTFYPDPVSAARAPRIAATNGQGNGFVFLKDQGGDENAQLYYYSSSANVQQLTKGKFLHGSPIWSHDGKRVAFYGNERDGISYDGRARDNALVAPAWVFSSLQDDPPSDGIASGSRGLAGRSSRASLSTMATATISRWRCRFSGSLGCPSRCMWCRG